MITPNYNLDKIKFATDEPTWEKAVRLYQEGKITKFSETPSGFSAVVLGTSPYRVIVSAKKYDQGDCECYLGQNDTLCKHMVAVAIYAVKKGRALTDEEKNQHNQVVCSGKAGTLSWTELAEVSKNISLALCYIKAYSGPSRNWFAYQDSLIEGCNRLASIISTLPANEQTAGLIIDLLLRLDKKLTHGGVDDSDGTVGDFIIDTVKVLEEFVKIDQSCMKALVVLKDKNTCFDWEEPLIQLMDEEDK